MNSLLAWTNGTAFVAGVVSPSDVAILFAGGATWAFHLSPGTLILAWMLATAVGALVGGFVGSFLGNCCAALVLKRVSDGHDLNQ